ncbi:hypothetical protein ACJIZ3_017063 [Penstemon smallii]|uniref:COP1-interacting protein 7 n=1 Tax=Penstemon smallii TaxID=265156 RepID=A0ABD3SUH0_9LAMI
MKPSTRLSSAVFQLTPTRTRCDLIIISNDKKEKLATGLLNPFLTHLKTARDQIAKGGYSILLEPETGTDAVWFTKATLERFVRFVSTPEILERVYTIETEILQIEDAIAVQRSNDIGQNAVEDHQGKHPAGCEGSKSTPSANEEKAIVLYQPGAQLPEANESCSLEGNSKVQLLKVLETRKTVLQKEQGMAFARAVAAGFDIEQMGPLVSFANCFGALRLMEACSRFMVLWKSKHETGQWLDIEASDELSSQSDFSAMNSSGIILSATQNKHDDSNHELASEINGKSDPTNHAANPVANSQQEYFQGQFPNLMFPPWAMHAPPGAQQVFPAYPVQGMPYYQAYTGSGLFHQQVHNPMENSPPNFRHQSGHKRQSLDGRDSNTESEAREIERTRSPDDMEAHLERSQNPRKRAGGSKTKQSGVVVIRNVNYITTKEKKSGSESNSYSDSDSDTENEISEAESHDVMHHNSKRSSNGKGSHLKSVDNNIDEVSNFGKDTDDGNWQAFQNCLLRGNDEDAHVKNDSMFAMEKDVKIKRHTNTVSDDPLALGAMDTGEIQDTRTSDIRRISGTTCLRPRGPGDDSQFSRADNDFRRNNDQIDIQFAETNGKKIISRTTHEDFMIGSQHRQINIRNSSDTLAVDNFEGATSKMEREYSHGTNNETFILPFRSMSIDQFERADRSAIDIDSEIPSSHKKFDHEGNRNKLNYEPDDLILMPERGTEKTSIGNNLAVEYEMQLCTGRLREKGEKDVNNVKEGLRKSDKDRRSKVISDSAHKQRAGGPIRKGKSSKMTPLEDARARAERLRSYKADLQKIKKEQEEAAAKRLEALKLERQKRIAAKSSSTAVLSPQPKQFPAKLSPATNRGSRFSDSVPGSSSPLQRSKIRTSLVSTEVLKASKASKSRESRPMVENRLTRSSSSLSETKRESNGVTPDSKASMARIRRLSEPKTISNSPVTLVKPRSVEAVSIRKLSVGPERNKMSAIINLDRSKAATLPELKIKTSKSPATLPSTFCEKAELNASDCNMAHHIDAYDYPIVDKTIVMLEYEKPSLPTLHSSEAKSEVWVQQYDDRYTGEKSNVISELAPKRAPPSPIDGVVRDLRVCQLQKQSAPDEVKTAYSGKELPNNLTAEESYQAPYARVSSLEENCTLQSQYCEAPPARSELVSRIEETVKAHVPDLKTLKLDKDPATSEKTLVKESSKGLRKLLKFGKKNPSSSVDQSVDSDCISLDGTERNDSARSTTSTSEVNMLKNLILQDETSHPGKTSRHFSLFSPFRSKTSEKKQAS